MQLCVPEIPYEDKVRRLNIHQIFDENGTAPDYFVSGPPEMIRVFKNQFITYGVPSIQVKTDYWE